MTGHVFVLHGRLEHLDADAQVIPTDHWFSVTAKWAAALGVAHEDGYAAADDIRPADWYPRRGFSRAPGSPGGRPTWFVAIDELAGQPAVALGSRVEQMLEEVAASVSPAERRPHPLVVVPVMGVSGGGYDHDRGAFARALLDAAIAVTSRRDLDVALMAYDPTDYSALQELRRATVGTVDPLVDRLAGLARDGKLALLIGAGVSMGAGLPSWSGLLEQLARDTELVTSDLSDLPAIDQAELIGKQVADMRQRVSDIVRGHDRYALGHALLASLRCQAAVTTNYDHLYEAALGDVHRGAAVRVLPAGPVDQESPWVLKLHGDVDDAASIVLTRSDFVGYDAASRPLGSVVQTLLLTKHLLVVGASLTDDNVLRLAHEVMRSARQHGTGGVPDELGTVLVLGEPGARGLLWKGTFEFHSTSAPGSTDNAAQARDLAIFLDAVAMHSSRATYMADERYGALLVDEEAPVAEAARRLAAAIGALPERHARRWSALTDSLRRHGADSA